MIGYPLFDGPAQTWPARRTQQRSGSPRPRGDITGGGFNIGYPVAADQRTPPALQVPLEKYQRANVEKLDVVPERPIR